MKLRRVPREIDAPRRIEDDDGGTDAPGDVCDACHHTRDRHDGGDGECDCGKCAAFKET